jgi:hypothetical protein
MRRTPAAVAALSLALVGVMSVSTASQAGDGSTGRSKRLVLDVQFSPLTIVATNNVRNPNLPFSVGDEILFHDQFFVQGRPAGDSVGSCVVVTLPPDTPDALANCTGVFRLTGGDIAAQFVAVQGPTPKDVAVTGGTGTFRNVGGDGSLVEFGDGTGKLTLNLIGFAARR